MDLVSFSLGSLFGCVCSGFVCPLLVVSLVGIFRSERARADVVLWRAVEPPVSAWSSVGGREIFFVHLEGDRVRVESEDGRESLVCSASEWAERARRRNLRLRFSKPEEAP